MTEHSFLGIYLIESVRFSGSDSMTETSSAGIIRECYEHELYDRVYNTSSFSHTIQNAQKPYCHSQLIICKHIKVYVHISFYN